MKRNFFIIGGGVAGLSAAYALLRQGHGVSLADHRHAGQSSWAGAGILCPLLPWDYDEAVNRLALGGMQAWPDWAAEISGFSGVDPEYWACGMEVRTVEMQKHALDWCRQHDFLATGLPDGTVPAGRLCWTLRQTTEADRHEEIVNFNVLGGYS